MAEVTKRCQAGNLGLRRRHASSSCATALRLRMISRTKYLEV